MMKVLVGLFFQFLSFFIFVSAAFDLSAKGLKIGNALDVNQLRYAAILDEAVDGTQNSVPHLELHLTDEIMRKEGLEGLDPVVLNQRRLLAVDQVWTSLSLDKVIFVKYGFDPVNHDHIEKLLPLDDGFLFHTKTPLTKKPVAYYFQGFKSDDIFKLIRSIRGSVKTKFSSIQREATDQEFQVITKTSNTDRVAYLMCSKTKGRRILGWLIPTAWAEGQPVCLNSVTLAMSSALTSQSIPTIIAKNALQCFGQIGNGIAESAKGLWNQIKTAVTNPKAFWESQVKSFNEVKNFLLHIGQELQSFAKDLREIDPALLGDMACYMIGQLAPEMMASLVGGVGLAKLIPKILKFLAGFKNSKSILLALSKLKKRGLLQNPGGALKLALQGKVPAAVENKLAALVDKYPEAMNALLSCR